MPTTGYENYCEWSSFGRTSISGRKKGTARMLKDGKGMEKSSIYIILKGERGDLYVGRLNKNKNRALILFIIIKIY